jgi:CRP/FNR family transcriptional regulator, cyclic AMP receptor protein
MFHRMLVPLDGSPQADTVLCYVSWLARHLDIAVMLLAASDPHAALTSAPPQGELERQLLAASKRLSAEGVQAATAVIVGRPAQEILRVAENHGCDLITLLTSTRHPVGQGILGRVTDKLFHTSHIPMLLIPPQSGERADAQQHFINTLIVPLDGSPQAETALPYVEDLCEALAAEIMLVRAVPFGGAYIDEQSPLTGEATAVRYLEDVAAKLRAGGFAVQTRVLGRQPVDYIVNLAGQTPHSLIVLTTHGRSALARWFVGSVAEGIIRGAGSPVLIIPRRFSQQHAAKVAELLARTPLFAELGQDDLEHLAEMARIRTYQRAEVIVREGEPGTGCFMIASGKVEVVKGMHAAPPAVLATLEAGEFFGEMAVIDDHPRSATVRALDETECVAIRRADFLETLQRRPEIAIRLLPILVRRLRQAEARDTE